MFKYNIKNNNERKFIMKNEVACLCKNEYSYIENSLDQIVDFKALDGKKLYLNQM